MARRRYVLRNGEWVLRDQASRRKAQATRDTPEFPLELEAAVSDFNGWWDQKMKAAETAERISQPLYHYTDATGLQSMIAKRQDFGLRTFFTRTIRAKSAMESKWPGRCCDRQETLRPVQSAKGSSSISASE